MYFEEHVSHFRSSPQLLRSFSFLCTSCLIFSFTRFASPQDFSSNCSCQNPKRDSEIMSDATPPTCATENEFDGRLGLRISAIFVIFVGSFLGAWFPTFASRRPNVGVPKLAFFVAKYFGSGVIIATGFIHVSEVLLYALSIPQHFGAPQSPYTRH